MDLSKFKAPDWLIVAGGVLFLIGGFLDWLTATGELFGVEVTIRGATAFDFFFTGIVPWLLIIGTAVLTVLILTGTIKSGTTPWPMIFVVATGLAALLVLIRFMVPTLGEDAPEGVDIGRGIGLWLCLLAAIVATVGAVMNFTASGGSFSHFTDAGKLKDAFRGPGPRPGPTPPPPPPPPAPAP